jgi:uncharacterized protein YndB with AHSA1/START domain
MRQAITCALVLTSVAAGAEVLDRSATAFTSRTTVIIEGVAPQRAFDALVNDVSRWWNPAHTFSGDAANLRLAATPGGCLCEALPDGGGVAHAVVNHVVPGEMLRLAGALGPLQEHAIAGTLTWRFEKAATGTTATATYRVSGAFPGGLDKIAAAVDQVIAEQIGRLEAYLEGRR